MPHTRKMLSPPANMWCLSSAMVAGSMLLLAGHGCGAAGDSRHDGSSPASAYSARLSLRDVNLGVVPRGGRREIFMRLANPTAQVLRWSKLRTTCPCLSVVVDKNALEPSGDAFAKVSLDSSKQPQFVGNLSIEVTAIGSDGAEVFRFDVRAEVVPEDELAFVGVR